MDGSHLITFPLEQRADEVAVQEVVRDELDDEAATRHAVPRLDYPEPQRLEDRRADRLVLLGEQAFLQLLHVQLRELRGARSLLVVEGVVVFLFEALDVFFGHDEERLEGVQVLAVVFHSQLVGLRLDEALAELEDLLGEHDGVPAEVYPFVVYLHDHRVRTEVVRLLVLRLVQLFQFVAQMLVLFFGFFERLGQLRDRLGVFGVRGLSLSSAVVAHQLFEEGRVVSASLLGELVTGCYSLDEAQNLLAQRVYPRLGHDLREGLVFFDVLDVWNRVERQELGGLREVRAFVFEERPELADLLGRDLLVRVASTLRLRPRGWTAWMQK